MEEKECTENREDKEQMEDETDEEDKKVTQTTKTVTELPERCPICNTKKSNILLHIKTKESCHQKIDKEMLEEWKNMARKQTKQKYQTKFNRKGGHNKARQRKREAAKELVRLERKKVMQKETVMDKPRRFNRLAGKCLLYLSQGIVPETTDLSYEQYNLIDDDLTKNEEDCLLNEDELHAWLKRINSQLFEAVITLQKVLLIPQSDWETAIKVVEETSDKEDLKDSLYRLIGKLRAYQHDNTLNISIPEKYKSSCIEACIKSKMWNKNMMSFKYIFTNEDEKLLLPFIEDILGKNLCLLNNKLQDLLKMKMENFFVALAYTTYD